MKKFMVLYLAPVTAEEQMRMARSPEDQKKGMDAWMGWMNGLGSSLVDGGTPLGMGANITASTTGSRKTQVAGYSVIQAESMEAAQKMVKNHPHFMMPMASIEILEMMPMSM